MVKGDGRFYGRIITFVPTDNMKICPDEEFVYLTKQSVPIVKEYYMVSNYGRVFNKYTGKFLSIQTGTDGYYIVALATDIGSKLFRINRLVMLAFYPIPNPDEMVVNHLDCDPKNNHISNLEWTTRTGNAIHAYDNGLMKYGEDGPTSVISKETAIEIAKLLQTDMSYNQIAETVGNGATVHIVKNILYGHGWVRDLKDYIPNFKPIRPKSEPSYTISKETVHELCRYFQSHPIAPGEEYYAYCLKVVQDFNYFGFDMSNIKLKYLVRNIVNIYRRRIHTDVTSQYDY